MTVLKYCKTCQFQTIHSSVYCLECERTKEEINEFNIWMNNNPSSHDKIENLYWMIKDMSKE